MVLDPRVPEDPVYVTPRMIWDELIALRSRVQSLETKVMTMFGGFITIGTAFVVYEALVHH